MLDYINLSYNLDFIVGTDLNTSLFRFIFLTLLIITI